MNIEINDIPKSPTKTEEIIKNKNIPKDILNEEDSYCSDYFQNNNNSIIKFENEENEYTENSSLLLENIINILEKLSINCKDQQKSLYKILKEINNAINLLIIEFMPESKKKININEPNANNNNVFLTEEKMKNEKDNELNKSFKLDINSKVVYMLMIEKLNRKIKSLNEEINNLKNILFINSNSDEIINQRRNNNFYKLFMKRFKEIKDTNKCDEYKYLIYIENQKKKIMDLEGQLNIKNNENLPKNIIKSIRCFPNFVQYNFKEDINPKTIPLYTVLQKEKIKEKEKEKIKSCSKSKKDKLKILSPKKINKEQIKPIYCTINNSVRNIYKTKNIIINDIFKTDGNYNITNTDKNIHKNFISIKDMKNNFKLFSSRNNIIKNSNIYNFNFDKINNLKSNTLNIGEKSVNKKSKIYKIKDDLENEVKKFSPQNLINNKREFFLAHPTLDIAGVAKGKEQAYIGLPKKLLKLNKRGNFKSTMMVFPSSLNETMVNLEKLKSNKLHVDINKKENENT